MTRTRANSGQAAKHPVAATPGASLPLGASVLSIVANLEGLDLNGLRRQWRAHLGGEAPAHLPYWLLMRVLAYRLQSDAFGDLDKSIRRILAAQQIVFQEAIDAIEDALQRLRRLEKQLALIVPEWPMAPVVEAYQAMRGASFLVSVTFAAEIGDVRRFDTPRQLMAFLGLVPAERSTGDTIRRKGLTLAGNRRARRALIEAAWTYRYPARVSETLRARLEGLPKPVRDIAWKAQVRLCARYRRLSATGKKLPVVVAAIAREMAAFLWAIGREVAPA